MASATTTKKPISKKATPKKAEKRSPLSNTSEPVQPKIEYIDYVIPLDPDREPSDQFFEYNVNGITYRHPRGVVLHHPREHAEAILAKLDKISRAKNSMAEFMNSSKKLN